MCSYAGDGNSASRRKQPESVTNPILTQNFDTALKRIGNTQSPQHFIDSIRHKILFSEYLNETYSSIRDLCFIELMWLYERTVIMDTLKEAHYKDMEFKAKLEEAVNH